MTLHNIDTISATLVTHGGEMTTLGGPSVRVPKTVEYLKRLGIAASQPTHQAAIDSPGDIAHVFNVWPPESCLSSLIRAKELGKQTILSPIFLNLSHTHLYGNGVPGVFRRSENALEIDNALMAIAKEVDNEPNLPIREPYPGYHERVLACIAAADHVIYLSEYERACLEHIGSNAHHSSLIHNPVDVAGFSEADPSLFRDKFGLSDYILCVGRFEPRKNQLLLAHAAHTLNLPVVFIGHAGKPEYADMVRDFAGPKASFIERIDPLDPLLKSAFAGAKVFCLPSWSEGAPLAALEAAAAGVPLILSDRSSEQEYFGENAQYVNPANIDSLRSALSAVFSGSSVGSDRKRMGLVASKFSWETYAAKTAKVYREIKPVSDLANTIDFPQQMPGAPIYFDLTTSYHFTGHPTGIARVEQRAYQALARQYGDRVIPIAWNSSTQNFLILKLSTPFTTRTLKELQEMEERGRAQVLDSESILPSAKLLILGGAWIRNQHYIACLTRLKRQTDVTITVLVHDLIQKKLAHFYPDGAGETFTKNAQRVISVVDHFLAYSDATIRDLNVFLDETSQPFKKISKFRLGDMADVLASTEIVKTETRLQKRFRDKKFVLFVSSIDIRKNHILLLNVWRRLLEERGHDAPHLILIGRPLWRSEEILTAAKSEKELRSHIHFLPDVDDKDLHWFYQNCLFTVFPSLYEGWGLPIAESLSYGKLCIASNCTSTSEVAPDLTDLLDPYDFKAWLDTIKNYVDNPISLATREALIREKYRNHPWSQSASEILQIVDRTKRNEIGLPVILPGTNISFRSTQPHSVLEQLSLQGWTEAKDGTFWGLASSSASIKFRYPGDKAHARIRLWSNQPRSASIRIDDTIDHSINLVSEWKDFDITIPASPNNETTRMVVINIEVEDSSTAEFKVLAQAVIIASTVNTIDNCQDALVASKASINTKLTPSLVQKSLQVALANTHSPHRLPPTRTIFRVLRATRTDRVILYIYRRLFNRTNDSLRRIIEILQENQK